MELGKVEGLAPLALAFMALDGGDYSALKRELRTWAKDDPMDALLATVVGGGLAFYLVEHETNPMCPTPWDGILYASTALSVGYDNLFPTTPIGHMIASAIQTFGPALANAAFDPPAVEQPDPDAVNKQILDKLEQIVKLLEARG